MPSYPFDCLQIGSRDPDLDGVVRQLLADEGHLVTCIDAAGLLDTLRMRTRPAVVIRNLNTATEQLRHHFPTWESSLAVVQRFGYVLLTLYGDWAPQLEAGFVPGLDITVLTLPPGLSRLLPTIEQVGQRVARRWDASLSE